MIRLLLHVVISLAISSLASGCLKKSKKPPEQTTIVTNEQPQEDEKNSEKLPRGIVVKTPLDENTEEDRDQQSVNLIDSEDLTELTCESAVDLDKNEIEE